MIDYNTLLKKGFSKKEAEHTLEILQKAEKEKSHFVRILDSTTYWILLIVAIVGNLILSILLLPFLLTFKKIPLYIIIIAIAALFGYLFDQLIRDIEHLENRHHIIAWLFIPALAVIDTYYMATFANHLTKTLALPLAIHSPILISIVYVFAFIAPYTIHNIIEIYFNY